MYDPSQSEKVINFLPQIVESSISLVKSHLFTFYMSCKVFSLENGKLS